MAHRALVAYERPDGRYDVHTSRWGGLECRLARTITPADPFADGAVDPEPRGLAREFDAVCTMVDLARHEALYRVGRAYAVETFLPLWFGLDHYLDDPLAGEGDPEGLLVGVESADEAAELRRWLRAAKAVLAEAVDAGYLAPDDAQAVLERATRRRAGERTVLKPGR